MRSVAVLLALAVGVFIPPPEPTAWHTIKMRWGEFDRSLMTDQLQMLIALDEHGQAQRRQGDAIWRLLQSKTQESRAQVPAPLQNRIRPQRNLGPALSLL